MSSVIRKISIGADYKNEAMHYSVSQQVYGGHIICNILHNDEENSPQNYSIINGVTKCNKCFVD